MTRLQHEMQRMANDNTRIESLEAEVERLRAALRPFAALARTYKVETGELNKADDRPLFGLNDAKITVGDMRSVLSALESP